MTIQDIKAHITKVGQRVAMVQGKVLLSLLYVLIGPLFWCIKRISTPQHEDDGRSQYRPFTISYDTLPDSLKQF